MQHHVLKLSLSRPASLALGIAALMLSGAALAHPAPGQAHTHLSGLLAGLAHPFTGIDHLLAMLAVGLWAGQSGGRATWAVPAGFVVLMAVAGIAALAGLSVPVIEPGILASLIALGLALAAAVRVPAVIGAAGVGVFAFFHGAAHGMEMPAANLALGYSCGFVLATILLHLSGVLIARSFHRANLAILLRLAGAGIAATGAALMVF